MTKTLEYEKYVASKASIDQKPTASTCCHTLLGRHSGIPSHTAGHSSLVAPSTLLVTAHSVIHWGARELVEPFAQSVSVMLGQIWLTKKTATKLTAVDILANPLWNCALLRNRYILALLFAARRAEAASIVHGSLQSIALPSKDVVTVLFERLVVSGFVAKNFTIQSL